MFAGSITRDLAKLYEEFDAEFRDSFYWFILSSNPKFYPVSGFQHFLGAGFVAARLAQFLGFSDYDVIAAFLGGIFHDFIKSGVVLLMPVA
jgi:HD superfamily phosphodiesterase